MILVIDSTEYKQDRGLNKEHITSIKALGKEGFISLHIPWFVYKETSTTCVDDLQKELNTLLSKLKNFNRKGVDSEGYEDALKIAQATENLLDNLEDSNKQLWDNFITESKATLHQYSPSDSTKVFEAYFKGSKPFKSLKKRDDIPDAFIYMTLLSFPKDTTVHFVSGDKNFKVQCANSNIIVYNSLEEFIDSDVFKETYQKYETKLATQERIAKVFKAKEIILENEDSIEDAVLKYTKNLYHLEFFDPSLPSDNNEGAIWAIDNPKLLIEEKDIHFVDDKVFIPITVQAIASIDYAIFKSDYWIQHERLPSIASELNKHYYLIEDVAKLELKKTLTLDIEDIKEDEVLEFNIIEFDSIRIIEEK